MMNLRAFFVFSVTSLLLGACAQVLEEQQLANPEIPPGQETLQVEYHPLNLEAVKTLNRAGFSRQVMRSGSGRRATTVSERSVLGLTPLPSVRPGSYRIGVGDELSLRVASSSALASSGDISGTARAVGTTTKASDIAVVEVDGGIDFIDTGRLIVQGKTLSEAREEVGNALIRNGVNQRFQLRISNFDSQKVIVHNISGPAVGSSQSSVPSGAAGTYAITNRQLSLRQLMIEAGVGSSNSSVKVATVSRSGKDYQMPVSHIYSARSPEYYLKHKDIVKIEDYGYRQEKAYVVGGGTTPTAFEVSPERRDTLADILFVEGGPFATATARNSEIYLLRGLKPMRAYHLNAQDPSRLRIAADTELRPKDIVFMTRKPIYSVNDLLAALTPLDLVGQRF